MRVHVYITTDIRYGGPMINLAQRRTTFRLTVLAHSTPCWEARELDVMLEAVSVAASALGCTFSTDIVVLHEETS